MKSFVQAFKKSRLPYIYNIYEISTFENTNVAVEHFY